VDRGTKQRIAGLTVALILVTPLSIVAARWQWSRHLEREALNAAVIWAERTKPTDWQQIAGREVGPSAEWRRVTAVGKWRTDQQWLVRKQVVDGDVGFTVLTPFVADDGTTLAVLRGWVRSADDAIPAPPQGAVEIVLRVRLPHGEGAIAPSDLPAGQINRVDPRALTAGATSGAIFELLDPVPEGLVPLPWPELSSGPHVSYFVQWILIGLTGVVVYVRVFRSEVRLANQSEAVGRAHPEDQ
jgi:cytochrome oxidase assembly protein ShyY1